MPTDPVARSIRLETIRRQIAAGTYAVSASTLAAAILAHMEMRLSAAA